tara:strand:- start:128 stop:343 length:216 start_codon:yes stop_codon:yes gene_type:complete
MGKVKELWMNELEKLQEDYCEANITEEKFRRGMYSLGVDKIDVDCFIIEAELLRAVNKAFKPLFKDAESKM